jgi:hypothetical protein
VGVNNRQRRAAEKRKAGHRPRPVDSWDPFIPEPTPELARATLIEAWPTSPLTAPLTSRSPSG